MTALVARFRWSEALRAGILASCRGLTGRCRLWVGRDIHQPLPRGMNS